MKKSILFAVCLIVIGVGGFVLYASTTPSDDGTDSVAGTIEAKTKTNATKSNEDKLDSEFANIPTKVASDTVSSSDNVLYYFYQPQCSHCIEIKEDIVDYYNDLPSDQEFYAVDLSSADNMDIWNADESSTVGTKIKTISDLQVMGTPTMVQLSNGEIQTVAVGDKDIIKLLKDN